MAFSNPPTSIIDVEGPARRERAGRFASKGTISPVTLGEENPWVFSSFMVSSAGDVVIVGTDHQQFLMKSCQVGFQYWAVGIAIAIVGTTATGIFVYGGV